MMSNMKNKKPPLHTLPGFTRDPVREPRKRGVAVIDKADNSIVYCNDVSKLSQLFCVSEQYLYSCLKHKSLELFHYNDCEYYICYSDDNDMIVFLTEPITIYPANTLNRPEYTRPAYDD